MIGVSTTEIIFIHMFGPTSSVSSLEESLLDASDSSHKRKTN